MKTKCIEIRDWATCIPVLAIKMEAANPIEAAFLWRRCGYPQDGSTVVLMKLDSQEASYDPYWWSDGRTMGNAHLWITAHWDEIKEGSVVDVRLILGEEQEPATPEVCPA